MELYVESLFEDELVDKLILHRYDYKHFGKKSDSDVLVVCKENRFYGAIDRMNQVPNISTKILTRKK